MFYIFSCHDYFVAFICGFVCLFVSLFRAAPAEYGHSQARDLIGAVAAGPIPEPQQRQI